MAGDRGFITWRPTRATMARIEEIRGVLDLYQAQLPVTLRQVFYVLIGQNRIAKTDLVYRKLGYVLRRARRARLIPFEAISDSGSIMPYGLTGWDEADDIRSSLSLAIENFDLDPQLGQERRVCVWCEAGGMVAQLERVAAPYGVHVVSGGGFDSVTDKHGFAQLVTAAAQPFTVLHIGDLDQAGESIFTVVSEDVPAFCSALGGDVVFHRLAITLEQVERYHLPLQPGAPRPIVQAEALPPDALAALVQTAIRGRLDLEKLVAVQRRTREVRVATMKALLSVGLGAPA